VFRDRVLCTMYSWYSTEVTLELCTLSDNVSYRVSKKQLWEHFDRVDIRSCPCKPAWFRGARAQCHRKLDSNHSMACSAVRMSYHSFICLYYPDTRFNCLNQGTIIIAQEHCLPLLLRGRQPLVTGKRSMMLINPRPSSSFADDE
jgi:hypothetical protein